LSGLHRNVILVCARGDVITLAPARDAESAYSENVWGGMQAVVPGERIV